MFRLTVQQVSPAPGCRPRGAVRDSFEDPRKLLQSLLLLKLKQHFEP